MRKEQKLIWDKQRRRFVHGDEERLRALTKQDRTFRILMEKGYTIHRFQAAFSAIPAKVTKKLTSREVASVISSLV